MKNLATLLATAAISTATVTTIQAQNYRLEAGVNVGASNYFGDIGGKNLGRMGLLSDIQLKSTSGTGGVYIKYALTPRINVRMDAQYGRIQGADSLTSDASRYNRNLSFRNDIKELSLTAEIDLLEGYNVGGNAHHRIDYSIYGIIGFGAYKHNPKAFYKGHWRELQPLQTEGIGYALTQRSWISGIGVDFTFNRHYKLGFRFTAHNTHCDYLDDISASYQSKESFSDSYEGRMAAALSDRSTENRPNGVAAKSGDPRGSNRNSDGFVFGTVQFAYVFKGHGGKYKRAFHGIVTEDNRKHKGLRRFFAF